MKKIRNKIIVILIMALISVLFMLGMAFDSDMKGQYLEHIDYQVNVDSYGNMKVVETWDINVLNTNTLVRNFNLDSNKFGNITNVEIVDLQTGKKLENIYEEMYHLPVGQYYALQIDSKTFEIAFGVGMDSSFGNRKFQISYVVEDVVADYKDCQEIYWQFLAQGQNSISAKKVTGKLTLPESVSNLDNLLIWGHGQLNGKIEKINNSQVAFEMDNLSAGAMFEIRVVTKDKMFEVAYNKIRQYKYLESILLEEGVWSDIANRNAQDARYFLVFLIIIYVAFIIRIIVKIVKLLKINKQGNNEVQIKYFRDIPRENTATPAEATYLYKFDKKKLDTGKVQSDAVSATILDLCYKRKITLRVDDNEKVYIKINSEGNDLSKDEAEIYKMLKELSTNQEEFEITKLNDYANKKYQKYSNIINNFVNAARNSLYNLNLINKSEEKLYASCLNAKTKIFWFGYISLFLIILFLVEHIPIIANRLICSGGTILLNAGVELIIIVAPILIASMCYWKLQEKLASNIAVLTKEGKEEKAKWVGLSNYMKEYSLLDEKDVLSLAVWEKYLIYATAFGIADKAIEQMKAKYPEVFVTEKWDDNNMRENYPVIYFAVNPTHNSRISYHCSISDLGHGVSRAYNTSRAQIIAHSSSGGSGGGGGFSGGGGGRRRPVAGMGGR